MDSRLRFAFHYLISKTKGDTIEYVPIKLFTIDRLSRNQESIIQILKETAKIDYSNKKLHIFLAGGIPFTNSDIDNFRIGFEGMPTDLYGIFTRIYDDYVLQKERNELNFNINSIVDRFILSPCVESTDKGLIQMSCLIGYFYNKGVKTCNFLRGCKSLHLFPPLITSLVSIAEHKSITNLDIMTVNSTLYAFFRSLISDKIQDNQFLEMSLFLCDVINDINIIYVNKISISFFDIDSYEKKKQYHLIECMKLKRTFYYYQQISFSSDLIDYSIPIKNPNDLKFTFTPNHPSTIKEQSLSSCLIVQGNDHEYLFIERKSPEIASVFNPMNGKVEEVNIDGFIKTNSDNCYQESLINLISNEINDKVSCVDGKVEQIVMIDLDESKSMDSIPIYFQYLIEFISKISGYRINSIQGLVSFNDEVVVKCHLKTWMIEGLNNDTH